MLYITFEELEVWKKARYLKIEVKDLTESFPVEEKYRLTDQVVSSVRSVGANIAEGFGRYHFKENTKFCTYARGSLMETLSHLIDAFDEGYINEEVLNNFKKRIMECNKVLNGYIAYLKRRSAKQ